MITYRLCFLTANDHLADTIDLPAASFDAAVKLAEGFRDGRRMELWQASQRLHAWPAANDAQLAPET